MDTGADISVLHNAIGNSFDVTPLALSASPTTGGGGIQVVKGIDAEFAVYDSSGMRTVRASGYTGIKSGNTGSNLLGMNHVQAVGARVVWDPSTGQGTLEI